jgi:DNA mismatch endonuclease (patch repair protein)
MTVDLVLPDLGVVVLVHGCFWHGCKKHYVPPSNNAAFWALKLNVNRARDNRQVRQLRAAGWRTIAVWEHSLETPREADRVASRILVSSRSAQRD